jgi:hypothetical protein
LWGTSFDRGPSRGVIEITAISTAISTAHRDGLFDGLPTGASAGVGQHRLTERFVIVVGQRL